MSVAGHMTMLQMTDSMRQGAASRMLSWAWCFVPAVCLVTLVIVFVQGAIPKITDPMAFARSIHRYGILPDVLINPLAIVLPWLELTVVLALLIPQVRFAGATILVTLLFIFTVAIGSALVRGLDISCGCFSTNSDAAKIGWPNLLRNAGLVLLVILAAWDRCPHRREGVTG